MYMKINFRNTSRIYYHKKFACLFFLMLITSCSEDSVTDEFNNANGPVAEKLITKITGVSVQYPSESATIFVNYDGNNRVSSVSDGTQKQMF